MTVAPITNFDSTQTNNTSPDNSSCSNDSCAMTRSSDDFVVVNTDNVEDFDNATSSDVLSGNDNEIIIEDANPDHDSPERSEVENNYRTISLYRSSSSESYIESRDFQPDIQPYHDESTDAVSVSVEQDRQDTSTDHDRVEQRNNDFIEVLTMLQNTITERFDVLDDKIKELKNDVAVISRNLAKLETETSTSNINRSLQDAAHRSQVTKSLATIARGVYHSLSQQTTFIAELSNYFGQQAVANQTEVKTMDIHINDQWGKYICLSVPYVNLRTMDDDSVMDWIGSVLPQGFSTGCNLSLRCTTRIDNETVDVYRLSVLCGFGGAPHHRLIRE